MQSIPINQALRWVNVVLLFSLLSSACASSTPGPVTEGDALPLEGVRWQWTEYHDDENVLTTPIAEPWIVPVAWMTFQDEKIEGKSGCNFFGGRYKADGKQLIIEIGGSTVMACQGSTMALETVFLDLLNQATSYEIEGNQLQILNAAGQPMLFFNALK